MMSSFKTAIVCIQSLLFCYTVGAAEPSLRQVNVLYRHGDRSPASIYPKDINQLNNTWPDGLGWLTDIGKQQQYELGWYLRNRYDGFINTSYYNHTEITVESSAVERCLMSAYCNLAGMFPPQGDQVWNPNIPWQPIPVQTRPVVTDNKLAEGMPCPRYDQLMQEVLNSPQIKKIDEENKEFYAFIQAETGIQKHQSVADIWEVADTLICEKAHNLTTNSWVNDTVWEKLNNLRTLSFDLATMKPEMSRLKGGILLKEIIENMVSSGTPSPTGTKFRMYSAHDTTVSSLLSAMKVFDCHQPIYRSLVMVELHVVQNVTEVRIYYRNDTNKPPTQLFVPGCNPCTLDKFIEATKDRVPVDWPEECKAKSQLFSSVSLSPASWIALIIGIGLCVAIAVAIIVMTMKLHRKCSANYSKI